MDIGKKLKYPACRRFYSNRFKLSGKRFLVLLKRLQDAVLQSAVD